MRLCENWFGGRVLIIVAKEKYLTVHVCGWFSTKCNWHTPTHVRGNGMYATHFEQLNIGIFVCGRSETLPTRPLVQPQLTGNAIRWAEKGCGVVDVDGGVRGFFTRGQCFLQPGRI